MKIDTPKWMVDKVIELYNKNPFTEFTLENLKSIRKKVPLGYLDIKHIILEYNTDTRTHPLSHSDMGMIQSDTLEK